MKTSHPGALAGLLIAIAIGSTTACEGDAGPTGPQGPQGEEGPEGPPGEDGNSNVTLHIFGGHDFSVNPFIDLCMGEGISAQETTESSWDAYLGLDSPDFGFIYFHMPGGGIGGESQYLSVTTYDAGALNCPSPQSLTEILLIDGPGEAYDEIRIVQAVANEVVDHRAAVVDAGDYRALVGSPGDRVTVIRH